MSNCEIKHDKGTSSSIYTGTSLMPNVVAKYVPEEFKVMERGEDFEVGRHPSELESGALLEETIKQQIRQSGSYQLSPFCLVLDSDVNMVELENGDVIPWRELQGLIGGVKIKDTAFSSVVPTEWHPAGKKEACRYTLQDGTKFDVTLEHEFETVMNGTVLKLPIHQIFDLKLPLLKANKVRPTRPLGQAKINFLSVKAH